MSGTNWAVSGGTASSITAYAAYTGGNLGTLSSSGALNVSPSGAQTAVTSAKSFNTLNLTGTEGLAMTGSGALTLVAGGLIGNTSGAVSGGTLEGSSGTAGLGELIVITPQDLTIGSVIANNGGTTGLTKAGPGTLTLAASNTYSGATTIGAGTLQISGSGALRSGTVTDNAALVLNLFGVSTFSGAVSGAGSLTQAGTGILTLTGSDTYAGGTAINAGTLKLGSTAALPGGTAATVNGTLDLGAFGATVGALSGTGTVNHSGAGGNVLTIGSGNADSTFSGTIENSGGTLALLMIGSGQMVLSGSDSYGGGTIIDAGALVATDCGAIPDGTSLTVGANGTFIFDPSVGEASATRDSLAASISPVPEPGTLGLTSAGMCLLFLRLLLPYARLLRRLRVASQEFARRLVPPHAADP